MAWEQLKAIATEARWLTDAERTAPLVDCPICATTLQANAAGVLHCPFGDWTEGD